MSFEKDEKLGGVQAHPDIPCKNCLYAERFSDGDIWWQSRYCVLFDKETDGKPDEVFADGKPCLLYERDESVEDGD